MGGTQFKLQLPSINKLLPSQMVCGIHALEKASVKSPKSSPIIINYHKLTKKVSQEKFHGDEEYYISWA